MKAYEIVIKARITEETIDAMKREMPGLPLPSMDQLQVEFEKLKNELKNDVFIDGAPFEAELSIEEIAL
jgi:hypothetical protein